MNTNFQPDGLPDYSTRHGHHVAWSRERETEQTLRETSTEDKSANSPPISEASACSNTLFQAPAYDSDASGFDSGSVLLLSHTVTGNDIRPIYVLVIGEWDQDWSWFMPFSVYSAPATDWELLTHLEAQPLQVLQVWNARSCPNEILGKGWGVCRVDLSIVESAKILYSRMIGNGDSSMGDLSDKIGTKIFDSDDPRLEYLKSEMQLLDHLTELAIQFDEAEASLQPVNVTPFVAIIPKVEEHLSLAAAGDTPDRKLAIHSWQVEGSAVVVHLVELLASPGAYTLRVENDSSGMFENATVHDGSGAKVGVIRNGLAGSKGTPLQFSTNSLSIQLSDGQSANLIPTDY
ncbi:MAG: hypothetical protein H7A51_19400 [Akkermansiaceae bacterium]|nr:hypothetical protein [Akkermansiaceae bacterium]